MEKKIVVLGASPKPDRYSNKAVTRLLDNNYKVIAIGHSKGDIGSIPIQKEWTKSDDVIDTVTLYLSPKNQKAYYETILNWSPRRVIFNPNTENEELKQILSKHNIETIEACTLVMLSVGTF